MKLLQYFDDFLENTVNLNKTRINVIEDGIKTVINFLKNDEIFADIFKGITPQGSYRQKTILKPTDKKKEFDVDILFELEKVQDWEPKDYLNKLHNQFKKSDRYEDIVDRRGKTRCVTLDYESDFHIDIVPCINTPDGYKIMNKNENKYEPTDGDGYAQWFLDRNKQTTKNHLIKVVRLVKYLRDIKQTFSAKSILLTTLIGEQVGYWDDASIYYPDLPTSFKTIFNRLSEYLESNSVMPEIHNPVLESERFDRHWDNEKYLTFRKKIKEYNDKFNEAYDSDDAMESAKKYREIFGDGFPLPPQENKIFSFFKKAFIEPYTSSEEQYLKDFGIVEDIRHNYNLKIDGEVLFKSGFRKYYLSQKNYHVGKKREINFSVKKSDIPYSYKTLWKVRNRGDDAKNNNQLRGEITWDHTLRVPEETKFTGVHYVECYAIIDNICVAKDLINVIID